MLKEAGQRGDGQVKIKICGMMRPEDIGYANEVQPDYVGFILSEPFRRHVTREQAASFREKLDRKITAVGVFVNEPCKKVIAYLQEGIIDMAQLHGEETEEDIRYIRAVTGRPVTKAVKVSNRYEVEAWLDSEADYLLFDSGTGTGKTFNWELLGDVEREFFLAGGLNPTNIEAACEGLTPYCIDLSSGVETDGWKDPAKMRAVVDIVRRM